MDNNPMLSVSVSIWRYMGFLDHKDKRRYIYLVPNSILNFLQLAFLCFSGESVEMLILNSYFFVLYFNALVNKDHNVSLKYNKNPLPTST